jgi:glyoxylate reductase
LEARRHRDIGSRRRRDPAAPVAALRKGTIAGAGLYVYEGGSAVSPELIAMKNVVLLPHLGSATIPARGCLP